MSYLSMADVFKIERYWADSTGPNLEEQEWAARKRLADAIRHHTGFEIDQRDVHTGSQFDERQMVHTCRAAWRVELADVTVPGRVDRFVLTGAPLAVLLLPNLAPAYEVASPFTPAWMWATGESYSPASRERGEIDVANCVGWDSERRAWVYEVGGRTEGKR